MEEDKIPVGTAEDLTGKQFGLLKVLYRVKNNGKTRGAKWRCECQCSNKNIVDVLAGNLKSGHTTSCGCQQKKKTSEAKLQDLTGQRFGRLIVLKRGENYIAPSTNGIRVRWICQCDCGNQVLVDSSSLKKGLTRSCGCLHNEITSKNSTIDLTGQIFGYLKVLERNGSRGGSALWKCECICGKIHSVTSRGLLNDNTKSCGCILSQGAKKIQNLLIQNNIPFETEKTFENCRFPDTNAKARFDFWVNNSYLIEFDGSQHYTYSNQGWNTKENFEKTQKRDKFKNEWCIKNHIPLIRIPYYNIENITIYDLIPNKENIIK